MKQCLNCKKEIVQVEGKREKHFCDDNCRASYWQKNKKKKEPKYVQFKTFQELQDKFNELAKRNGEFDNSEKEKEESEQSTKNQKQEINPDNSELLKQIEAIKAEVKPSFFSKEKWERHKLNRISELELKLKK